ncbi:MAG: hypothetical protein GJ680_17105 [Alteromonadaceae bacterium]|nr:hypothetical protein [Alteromonadaceae bacterium]
MSALQIGLLAAFLAALFAVVKRTDFNGLTQQSRIQHIIFGTTAALFSLWLFRTGIYEGLNVHFLWVTAAVLTLGFRWSFIACSLALCAVSLLGLEDWRAIGAQGLFGVLLPIVLTYAIFTLSFHRLPRNVFVYIFVFAFFAGFVSITAKMGLLGVYYYFELGYDWHIITDNYLILIPLLVFPEGLLNGMTMTLLIIYKPSWVYTFHDKFYIDGK